MRICYLNHDLRNDTGAGHFCSALLNALKKRVPDFEYQVLTHDDILPENGLELILVLPRIRKILKEYDVIHALDGWPYGVIAAFASAGLKKKLIITAIGTGAIKPLYQPIKSWLLKWAYKKADAVTAVSGNTKREILKKIPDLKIEVINHGVEYEKFSPFGRSLSLREISRRETEGGQIQISNFKPYILSVGTDKPRKGFEYSIRAFAEIKKELLGLKYVIVSDIHRKEIKDLIKKLNLEDRIVILKNLEEKDLINVYKNAELFILLPCDDNKDIEGFGLVFLEAAACGLPVIGTRESSATDAVLDDKNGILVSPRDYLEAAKAIGKILSNSDLKINFSRASLEFAKSMSWSKAVEAYVSIYRS